MKRTLHKRAGLWELSVPLRAPVRGIWRYATFEEAWGHLWRAGYPAGLPIEIKMAVRSADPARLGIDYLADVDDAVRDAFDSTNDLLAAGISVPQLTPAEPSEIKRDPPEPLRFPGTHLSVPASSKPLMPDSEVLISDAATVNEYSRDVMSETLQEAVLPWDEPKPAPHASPWISRAIAVGLTSGLMILLLILFWRFSYRGPALPKTTEPGSAGLPAVADSTRPNTATTVSKPTEDPVALPVSGAGKSHASIQTKDRSWITVCVDGKVVFSKLFTAGSKDSVDFIDRAVVRMGDAGPVEITLDGKPVGSLGRMGQVRVVELVRGAPRFLVGGEPEDCTLAKSR